MSTLSFLNRQPVVDNLRNTEPVDRRAFLNLAAAGCIAGATSLAGSANPAISATAASTDSHGRHRIACSLPASDTRRWAWTIDDGVSSHSISTYVDHALRDPSIKYTYFVTSMYSSWRQNAKGLRELIGRGQVQLANHTRSHPDLRTLTSHGIQKQLLDCQKFLEDEFGSAGSTFWRPPYGYFDSRVLAAAADAGFTTPVMWMGTFGTDSGRVPIQTVYSDIKQWVQNGRIVIDHANYPLAADHFDQVMSIIKPKGLQMATLAEAFPDY